MEGFELQRVIPIVQRTILGEKTFTLIALELYEDGARLTYMTASAEEPVFPPSDTPERMMAFIRSQRPEIRVEDDLGSVYHANPGGGGGGKVHHGTMSISPAIPQAATKLSLFVHVPWKAGDDPNGRSEVRFDVAL